ncbi:hypothetical protein Glove_232g221 [Diversispora epigaea]|uniref:Uncharacterized protein n=1 Tax=Diversispora epigaea TaxID=1348612 RepID=A0A397IKF1_9GLOM|nr:hypothetical protein Glove_232g221 [Diversispora epigaea]
MSSKLEAKDKSCIIVFLAKNYSNSQLVDQLKTCKTEEKQKWRHASADAAVKKLTEIAKYFPELTLLLDSLENYSLCEKHYNNIVAKKAKDKSCIIVFLAKNYSNSQLVDQLKTCKTEEKQKWRHASADAAVKKLTEIAKYFPELTLLLDSLENYSLCEKHYNNIVAKSSFIKQLTETDNSIFLDLNKNDRKKLKISTNDDEFQVFNSDPFEKTSVDFGVQVSLLDPAYEMLLKKTKELEYLNMQLLSKNEVLKRRLDEQFKSIEELEYFNQQLLSENKLLKRRLGGRFTDQEDHIKSIKTFKRAVAINAIYTLP